MKKKGFFTEFAEEGNKCVVCKFTHLVVSCSISAYATNFLMKNLRRTSLIDKIPTFFSMGVFGVFTVHNAYSLYNLWKKYKEEKETIPKFAKRQILIWMARHKLYKL